MRRVLVFIFIYTASISTLSAEEHNTLSLKVVDYNQFANNEPEVIDALYEALYYLRALKKSMHQDVMRETYLSAMKGEKRSLKDLMELGLSMT